MSEHALPLPTTGAPGPARPAATPRPARASRLARLARHAVLSRLSRLHDGELELLEGGARWRFGRPAADGLRAAVRVEKPSLWLDLALRGHLGAADAFADGAFACDDLAALVRLFVRHPAVMDGLETGPARLVAPALALGHALRRNTRAGARRNIAAHYDLGNEFYAHFLDPTLTYSAATFERDDLTLEEAQLAKIDRLCRKLGLGPEDHLLEIGTGWGAFAVRAAQRFGCRVTTTTLSREQARLARERVRAAGLEARVRVLEEDYRDLRGTYSHLVSVEMIEAVGHQYLETFFRACAERLAPDGIAALQAITIADQRYERARRSVDFIKQAIFPGSCIPSVTALLAAATRASDLRLFHLEDQTPHYARTLGLWRERFLANRTAIRGLGYPEPFLRTWEMYLAYCEGGFAERHIGSVQMVWTKPGCRRAPLLGAL